MRPRQIVVLLAMCWLGALTCRAGDDNSGKNSQLTEQHRIELIRTFNADLVYIRTQFPMGKTGLTIKDDRRQRRRRRAERLAHGHRQGGQGQGLSGRLLSAKDRTRAPGSNLAPAR